MRAGRIPAHLAEFVRLITTGPGLLRAAPRR
jgi:hypothetical protein